MRENVKNFVFLPAGGKQRATSLLNFIQPGAHLVERLCTCLTSSEWLATSRGRRESDVALALGLKALPTTHNPGTQRYTCTIRFDKWSTLFLELLSHSLLPRSRTTKPSEGEDRRGKKEEKCWNWVTRRTRDNSSPLVELRRKKRFFVSVRRLSLLESRLGKSFRHARGKNCLAPQGVTSRL